MSLEERKAKIIQRYNGWVDFPPCPPFSYRCVYKMREMYGYGLIWWRVTYPSGVDISTLLKISAVVIEPEDHNNRVYILKQLVNRLEEVS